MHFKQPAQLHSHSMYSALDALPSPEEWLEWCLKTGTPGLSITDHGTAVSMFHAIRFPDMIKKYNKEHKTNYAPDAVTGIPGVELYVKLNKADVHHYHLICWAVTTQGYHNLMKLASLAYDDAVSYFGSLKPRVTFDLIQQYREGLKFGTACIASPMGEAIMEGNHAEAEHLYSWYVQNFGEDLYVEFHPTDLTHNFDKKTGGFVAIGPNACCPDGNYQKAYNLFLLDMVEKYGGKPIPATDAHFLSAEDKIVQDCLLKAGNDSGWHFHQSYHQKTADEIYAGLKTHLGDRLNEALFATWIENTYEVMDIAKSIEVKHEYHLPKIDIPEHILSRVSGYDNQTLHLLVERSKAHGRWRDDPEYVARFKKEVDVILKNEKLNLIPYFLIYEDICTYARSTGVFQNIARGSAGGSLISYYLKIIHIDPIENKLPFERFLSHARIRAGSFPDIDLDLSDRGPILIYLEKKYGLGFAQIATYQKMKTKNAIKDGMWALYGKNRNDPEVRSICNLIPDSPQGVDESDFLYGYTDQEDTYHQGQVEINDSLATFFKRYPDVERMVKKLIGVVRGFSRHASAYVVSSLDLSADRAPTMRIRDAKLGENVVVTQYDAGMCEKVGLVKADILRVTMVETVKQCVDLIKVRKGTDLHTEDDRGVQAIYRLPEDDSVYADFFNKKTDSSFQFNTGLVKGYVQQFLPVKREDLSDFTSLCRPGALDAPLPIGDETVMATQYYVDVKQGKRKLQLLHPDMANYTTYGVIVYQEQVMAFLVEICGYSWEESDQIRSAIAKKKHDVIMATFTRIREATHARGWTNEQSDAICQIIQAFSRYSFNRSHARAYSELGYMSMYLKHHYPLEWWTAVLNTTESEDKLRHYVTILKDILAPPSLAYTNDKFQIVDDKIVSPTSIIKGIGVGSTDELQIKGPFESFDHFLTVIDNRRVNAGHFVNLVKSRAVDCFMDQTLPYGEAKKKLLDEYIARRKCKPFAPEVYAYDPLSLFLMEKETNQVFNRQLMGEPAIQAHAMKMWPGLEATGNVGIPLLIGGIPVVRSLDIAAGMMERGHEGEVALILLYGGSTFKHGISKKSGRPWEMLEVELTDGVEIVQCAWWKQNMALKWPKDCLVYVSGELRPGYNTPVSINVKEMRRVIEE